KQSEQGVSPNVTQSDTIEAPKGITSQNSSKDKPGFSQATEQQEIQVGHWEHKSSHPIHNILSPLDT
ncbi:hypothetical protein HAX54_050415, partial [Datura stramonium]|nr:hypothetical protein [Datura stramonium]